MAILDDGGHVRMAHLAIVGSHSVNGVAALHTRILRESTFAELRRALPRPLQQQDQRHHAAALAAASATPGLAALISEAIGDGWITDLDELRGLAPFAEDAGFRAAVGGGEAGQQGRARRPRARSDHGLELDPDTLFDCQVKRIHEYKRQLLNVLHVIALYHRLARRAADDGVPRTVIFAGKAAPGYAMAKLIIKLIHAVRRSGERRPGGARPAARRVPPQLLASRSPSGSSRPASCPSRSRPAGTEASGTGNMKAALNGALTIGTLDGANVEIREEVGPENIFIFGHTAAEIDGPARRAATTRGPGSTATPSWRRVVDAIAEGELEGHAGLFRPVVDALLGARSLLPVRRLRRATWTARPGWATTYGRPDDWLAHVDPERGGHGAILQRPDRLRVRARGMAGPAGAGVADRRVGTEGPLGTSGRSRWGRGAGGG